MLDSYCIQEWDYDTITLEFLIIQLTLATVKYIVKVNHDILLTPTSLLFVPIFLSWNKSLCNTTPTHIL